MSVIPSFSSSQLTEIAMRLGYEITYVGLTV